jgi:AcrR family transcriptional regulator
MVNSRSRDKLDRQTKVAEMRLAGFTSQRAIAQRLGVDKATISRDFKELDAKFQEIAAQVIVRAKGLDLERIEALIDAIWAKAENGDTWSIDRIVKLLERKANMLGLDAPKKTEVTGKDGGPMQVEHITSMLAADMGLDPEEVLAEADRIVATMQQRIG